MTAGRPQLWLIGYLAQISSIRLNRHSPAPRQFLDQNCPLERLGQRQIALSAGKRRSKLAGWRDQDSRRVRPPSTRPGRARLIQPPICAFKASPPHRATVPALKWSQILGPRVGQPRNDRDRPRSPSSRPRTAANTPPPAPPPPTRGRPRRLPCDDCMTPRSPPMQRASFTWRRAASHLKPSTMPPALRWTLWTADC